MKKTMMMMAMMAAMMMGTTALAAAPERGGDERQIVRGDQPMPRKAAGFVRFQLKTPYPKR